MFTAINMHTDRIPARINRGRRAYTHVQQLPDGFQHSKGLTLVNLSRLEPVSSFLGGEV